MKNNSLKYIPQNSMIHKLNPSIKLLYLLFYIIICFLPYNLDYIILASFILVLYLLISSKIPLKFYFNIIYKIYFIILALFIILASYNYTFISSVLISFKLICGVWLYAMIIYTTKPFDLAYAIFSMLKNISIVNPNDLFIRIYNKVMFRYDYKKILNNVVEGLEIKGKNVNGQNIITRFFIKISLLSKVLNSVKNIQIKRKKVIIKNKFNVRNYKSTISVFDIIFLLMFISLIIIYYVKVIQ